MIYRSFGQTDKKISAISFGGMRFDDIDDIDLCAELLHYAYSKGINYFDTAPVYFGGKSEERFGVAFKEMRKTINDKPFYVATKSTGSTPSDVRRDLETSLTRMGLDHIDFFHVWWVVKPEWYYDRKKGGGIAEFTKIKEEGLAKHIVLSSHMTGDQMIPILNDYPFDGTLIGYSAANAPFREKGLQAAADKDIGVIVMNPLNGGIIPKNPKLFSFLKTQQNETTVEAALRFLLNDSRITSSLVGFSNKSQVDEAINAVNGFKPISAEKIAKMNGSISKELNKVCTGCQYCDSCPEELPIPQLMLSYNEGMLSKDRNRVVNALKYAYGLYPEGHLISSCSKCGKCEDLCTQQIDIIKRLEEMEQLVKEHEKNLKT